MKKILLMVLALTVFPALAERIPMPKDTPPSYSSECSTCHMAYPPALLSAGDWKRIMGSLDQHFGTDASLDAKKQAEITGFLEKNGSHAKMQWGTKNPPRITQTGMFLREHGEIPKKYWSDPRVKSAANCEACHRNAAKGVFSERDIAIPGLKGD